MTGDAAIGIIAPPPRESGYALIGTVWLLLLATGLAALLMVRATHGARELAALRAETLAVAREESALETAAADILLNGALARIATLPSEATYEVSGQSLTVTASSEAARLDIDAAPLDVIDATLETGGLPANDRSSIIARLRQRRARATPYVSTGEIEAELQRRAVGEQTACIAQAFTVHSGRTSRLDTSTGAPGSFQGFGAIRLRLTVDGRERRLIFHRGSGGAPPIFVIETGVGASCP